MMKSKLKAKHISGQRAPALDMASVSTKAPPENPVSNPPTRIFGLQDAPCYYPTEKEFMEPLRFIESIRPEAEKAGICKIIPPEGWKPTFALDTELFRFKTRIQKLNSMEGETRTNINYLDQLYKFHRQQGHPVLKIPQLDKRPIDLFRLKKEVAARGGYQKVTAGKKWAEIGRGLDYTRKQCTSLSNALKSAYVKVILPYEIYLSKQARPPSDTPADTKAEPSDDSVTPGKQPSPTASTSTSTSSSTSKVAVGIRKSKRIKKDPVSYADSEPSSPSYSERMSSEPCEKKEASVDPDMDVCEVCQTENDLEMMLICDGCELGYHTYCLTPPLTQIPRTDWYCAKCLVAGDDFGFEEGEEYSLSSFQQKCNSFKTQWFEKHGFKDGKVPEDAVEREFWKLVEDAYETVQVEYGADLHSTQHGSGFPSLERHPNDKYSTHPSNLNNMPVLPESLFCHIKSDISGMMIPWLYVGMCFSTFCWHNEDHYTYSINYMHWGDTKTWYGIPASDALKFEDTMKQAVPELFEQQPDLLFQLVTMLSPERLVANGVKVLALDQRPGQFVVTFPQAYHAGFNHGFNFAEAVNFAPPDWCQLGLECVKRYKEHKKQPVFSHDELIITTALDDTSIATAQWLQRELDNLLERELSCRQSVQKHYPEIAVVTEETDRPEEEVQCHHCNAYIYLSQVVCKCSSRVVCDEHVDELCNCEIKDKTLRLRYSDDYLKDLAKRVSETAAIPGAWTDKFRKIMMETRVPSLKMLRSLLSEADKIPFMFREAAHLREFVAKANDWVEAATKLMIRKHHQGRRVLERTQGSAGKRLEDLQGMLDQAERLRFDCPEIKQLQESIETMQEFQMEARRALDRPVHNLQECRELQEAGLGMNISMEEIDQLDTIVTDLSWIERATTKGVHVNDYHLICSLVTDAERMGVSPSNTLLMDLIRKQRAGQDWEASALAVLNKNSVDLDRLQAVIDSGKDIAVPRTVMSKAETLYNKVIEWEKTAAHLLKKANDPLYSERPNISELKRAVRLADSIPSQLEHKEYFEGQAKKFDDWFSRTYQLFNPGDVKRVGPALDETLEDLQANVEACTVDENFDKSAPSMSRPVTEKSLLRPNAANGEAGRVPIEGPTLITETEEADQSNESRNAPEGSEPQTSLPTDSTAAMDVDEDQIYCLCRTAESGMMVECDECHEWYHGTCVRVTKREASSKSNYICPVCNLSIVIRRDNHRPTLGQLAAAYTEGHSLHFSTVNVPALGGIVAQATQFMEKVDRFLQRESITLANIKQVKGFLRKVEGLDIDLVRERDVLRNHILRLIPSSMPAGGVQFSNFPSAPPPSTINSQCICLGTHSSPSVQQNGFALESGPGLMIQCGGCQDWYHLDCVGMNSDQAHRLTRFSCPICAIVRKKGYPLGTPLYPEEVSSRASERIHAAREQAELKKRRRKSSKDSIDLGNGAPAGTEEKKRRVYKKRDPSDGENKPRRRKSSGGQSSVSTDSNTSTPTQPQTPFVSASGANVGSRAEPAAGPVTGSGTITMGTGLVHGPTSLPASGSTASTATTPSATTLPSFSEGFLLPHESVPLSQARPRVHHPPHPQSQPRPVFHSPPARPVPQDVHVPPSRPSHAPLRGSSHPHSAQQHQGHPGPHPVQHIGQHGHSSHSAGQTSSHPSHSGHSGQHSSHPGHPGNPSQHPNQHSSHPYTPPAPVHRSRQQQTPPHPGHAPIHHPVPHPSHHPAHPTHSSHSHSRSHVPPNHSHSHSPPYQHSPPQRYHPGTPPYQSPPPLRDAVKLAPIQGHPPRERPSSGPPSHYDRPPYAGPSPGQYTPPQMSSSASPSSTSTSPQITHHRRDRTSHSQPPMPHHHPHTHSHSSGSPTSRPYFGYSNGQGPHPQAPHPSMPASVRSRSPTMHSPVARGHPSYPPHPSHPPHPPHRSHSPQLHPSHTSARPSYPSLAHAPHPSHSSHSSHPSHSYPSHPPHPSQHHRGSMHPRGPRGDVVEIESDEEMR